MSAAGSQTRVGPDGFSTSTRVVTSNVRQASDPASSANIRAVFGNARLADTTPAVRRKSRRFINPPLGPLDPNCDLTPRRRVTYTPHRPARNAPPPAIAEKNV